MFYAIISHSSFYELERSIYYLSLMRDPNSAMHTRVLGVAQKITFGIEPHSCVVSPQVFLASGLIKRTPLNRSCHDCQGTSTEDENTWNGDQRLKEGSDLPRCSKHDDEDSAKKEKRKK
jgi:hypothetical protein